MNQAAQEARAAAQLTVLDGARIPDLKARLEATGTEWRCLFQGESEGDLADLAPYVTATDPVGWAFDEGWGDSWGIHLETAATVDEVRAHLRRFLMVLTHDGKQLYFRLYDPRVLRIFLPTCDAEQLETLFGPISAFIVESDDPAKALVFTLEQGALKTKTLPAATPIVWKGKRDAHRS